MSYEIVNAKRGSSIMRVEGAGTYNVAPSAFSVNTALEVVSDVTIKRLFWTTGGSITVARGATPNTVLTLYGSGEMRLDDFGYTLANGSTGNVVVTIATGGSAVIEVGKTATYTTNLDTQ